MSRAGSRIAAESSAERWSASVCAALLRRVVKLIRKTRRGSEGPGHVHRLRTACRRAEVGLQVLAVHLPQGRARRAVAMCSKLRRASGRVRDCDVAAKLSRALARQGPRSERGVWKKIVEHIERRRSRAFKALSRRCSPSRTRRARALGRSFCPGASGAAIPSHAPAAARDLLAATARAGVDMLAEDLASDETMHRVRLQLKRVRVALGLLCSTRADRLEKRVGVLTDLAGAAHDLLDLSGFLEHLAAKRGTGKDPKDAAARSAVRARVERAQAQAARRARAALRRDGRRLLDRAVALTGV